MPITRPVITKLAEIGVRDGSSTTAELSLGRVEQRRKFSVYYADGDAVARHFLGYSQIKAGKLERLLPAAHPDTPALVAVSVRILRLHKFEKARGVNPAIPGSRLNRLSDQSIGSTYEKMEIEVCYERPMYDLKEDKDVTANTEFLRYVDTGIPTAAAEVYTIPGHVLKYIRKDSGSPGPVANLPLAYNVPKVFPQMVIPFTWKRLPANLIDYWDAGPWLKRLFGDPFASSPKSPYFGTVNKFKFAAFPAGTLRLENVCFDRRPAPFVLFTLDPSFDPTEQPPGTQPPMLWQSPAVEWDVKFDMRYDPIGHLKRYYNALSGVAEAGKSGPVLVGSGSTYYTAETIPDDYGLANTRDFADLFNVGEITESTPVSPPPPVP